MSTFKSIVHIPPEETPFKHVPVTSFSLSSFGKTISGFVHATWYVFVFAIVIEIVTSLADGNNGA